VADRVLRSYGHDGINVVGIVLDNATTANKTGQRDKIAQRAVSVRRPGNLRPGYRGARN